MSITVIGAGKTGRGFIGRLLAESGKSILFIDKNEVLVKELNEKKQIRIGFLVKDAPPSRFRASPPPPGSRWKRSRTS